MENKTISTFKKEIKSFGNDILEIIDTWNPGKGRSTYTVREYEGKRTIKAIKERKKELNESLLGVRLVILPYKEKFIGRDLLNGEFVIFPDKGFTLSLPDTGKEYLVSKEFAVFLEEK